jgi:tetratricopeptide (TPR) repeat protein
VRTAVLFMLFGICCLQACTSTDSKEPVEPAPVAAQAPPPYETKLNLTSQQRFREVLSLLENGRPGPARAELLLYLQEKPKSAIGRDMMAQIDLPATEYFPEDYREIQLAPGQSLSTLAEAYLGSVYQFYALAKYNDIDKPRNLRTGQTLRIPLTEVSLEVFAARDSGEAPAPAAATGDAAKPKAPGQASADKVKAVAEVEKAGAVAPAEAVDVEQLHREALNAYRAQDLDKAIGLWDQVLVLDPDHESARLYRSQSLELQEKLRKMN